MKSISNNIVESELCQPDVKFWYAVNVLSRHEKKIYKLLLEKGIETSLPLTKTIRQWSDRKKRVDLPLFSGYIFVRIDIGKDKLNVLKTNGIVRFIGIQNNPSKIPNEQIHWIHMMVEESADVRNETKIPIGQQVCVTTGPFKGAEGVVIRTGNRSRLVINVESIMHVVSIEINPNYLKKVNK